jgi:hypothetical protein
MSFLLFPVDRPELFDSVEMDETGRVRRIAVKSVEAPSNWIWGAFKLPPGGLHRLHDFWCTRQQQDEFVGTLVNAWLVAGGEAFAVRSGESYVDVGTLHGWREAMRLLEGHADRSLHILPGKRRQGPHLAQVHG